MSQFNNYLTANSIDGTNDLLLIYQYSTGVLKNISRNTYLGVTAQPVDISTAQSLTNKTIGITNSITQKDSVFTLENSSDNTKVLNFGLGNLTTGTTNTLNVPLISTSDTIVTLGATQTLVAKTLTSPTINSGTISNATISVNSISGYTTSNSGTIFGGLTMTTGNAQFSGTLGVTGAVTLTAGLSLGGSLTGTGLASQVQSFSNSGSGGGTGYYINLGGIKYCWGTTATVTLSGGAPQATGASITFPNSFFSSIQSATISTSGTNSGNAYMYATSNTAVTTTGWATYLASSSGTGGSTTLSWFVVGT